MATFRRCRQRGQAQTRSSAIAVDQSYWVGEGIGSQPERRSAVFRGASATLHNTVALTLKLLMNAMVTGLGFYIQAGVGTSTATN
jgi:hypothetical protein